MRSVVTVWTRWGDYVLEVRAVRRGESIWLGSPLQEVLRFDGDGPKLGTLAQALCQEPRLLAAGESFTVSSDGLDYTLSRSSEDELPDVGSNTGRRILGAGLALGALLSALSWYVAAPTARVEQKPEAVAETLRALPLAAEESVPPQPSTFAVVSEPTTEPLELLGDSRCGQIERGRRLVATQGPFHMQGPRDNADPHVARPVPDAGYPTAHGALAALGPSQTQPGSVGPTAVFGRDSALGTDAGSASGKMWSDDVNEAEGDEGMGLAGRVGGVTKTFAIASVSGAGEQTRVLHTGLSVRGARKPSEVGRVMAAHFGEFRACAAGSPLAEEPHLVRLELDIAPEGRVVVTSSGTAPLEQCLERAASSFSFARQASDSAHVVYPLYFTAAAERLQPAQAAPPASAACDCAG